jgi:hypothetical protein
MVSPNLVLLQIHHDDKIQVLRFCHEQDMIKPVVGTTVDILDEVIVKRVWIQVALQKKYGVRS